MGTYSGFYRRDEIRRELTNNGEYRSCWVGNHLWIIYPASASSVGVPFIGLGIVTRYGPEDWAYKPVDELGGPYHDSCPKAYLDVVPVPPASVVGQQAHEWAKEFRERCAIRQANNARIRQERKARLARMRVIPRPLW